MKKYLPLILVLILFSCKQDEIPTEPSDWKYSGMKIGSYRVYEVEEITYFTDEYEIIGDSSVIYIRYFLDGVYYPDTNNYFVKEVIDRKEVDLEGDSIFVIERYYSDTKEWDSTPDSVWTSKYERNQYLRTENNAKFAKLVFPVSTDLEWDYNAHNAYEEDLTAYSSIRIDYQVDDKLFHDVVIVEKEHNAEDREIVKNPLAEKYDIQEEYYAAGIGMIYKEQTILINCQNQNKGSFCSQTLFIISEGTKKIEKLIEYEL